MAFKVAQLFDSPDIPDYQEMFKQAGLEVELVRKLSFTEEEIIATARDADAIIGAAIFHPFSKKVMENLPKCRFIMSLGIGFDQLDVAAATAHGILAANVPDYCIDEVSDHTMALILACTRRIVELDNAVKGEKWETEPDPGPKIQGPIWPKMSRLRGQTLGLIGFGRIPRTLVPKAKGFGLKIIAYDPYVSLDTFEEQEVERVEQLDQLFSESDIISIHTALTPETRHIIKLEHFKKMKPTACFINSARGPLIELGALYTALTGGHIAAAAVDVTEPEPINRDDPLLKLDNFVVTAHSAHYSPTGFAELMRRPAEEVIRVFKGEWPIGLINSQVKEKYLEKWGK